VVGVGEADAGEEGREGDEDVQNCVEGIHLIEGWVEIFLVNSGISVLRYGSSFPRQRLCGCGMCWRAKTEQI
jgi:hypothetical protein